MTTITSPTKGGGAKQTRRLFNCPIGSLNVFAPPLSFIIINKCTITSIIFPFYQSIHDQANQ